MLRELIESGFGKTEDYNCSERIIYGANKVYDLGLDENTLRVAAGFGGGMGTGRSCGAVLGALMAISAKHTVTVAHQSPEVKAMAADFQARFEEKLGTTMCVDLKEKYFEEDIGCHKVILAAAQVLDEMGVMA